MSVHKPAQADADMVLTIPLGSRRYVQVRMPEEMTADDFDYIYRILELMGPRITRPEPPER